MQCCVHFMLMIVRKSKILTGECQLKEIKKKEIKKKVQKRG